MNGIAVVTCLWPGLAPLWMRGQWTGLLAAIGFTIMLNLALVASFVWPELLTTTTVRLCWILLGVVWSVSSWHAFKSWPELTGTKDADVSQALFLEAQSEYLKGEWFEVETILLRLLNTKPQDVEARLLLATAYRHNKQLAEASEQLEFLSKTDGSEYWTAEIMAERRLLAKLAEDANASDASLQDSGIEDLPLSRSA